MKQTQLHKDLGVTLPLPAIWEALEHIDEKHTGGDVAITAAALAKLRRNEDGSVRTIDEIITALRAYEKAHPYKRLKYKRLATLRYSVDGSINWTMERIAEEYGLSGRGVVGMRIGTLLRRWRWAIEHPPCDGCEEKQGEDNE